jgi:uncharacterized membrane protein|tara:strand:- start:179 stop:385 length:207 start_codon:yes stop_codon:yes gene_type:complete
MKSATFWLFLTVANLIFTILLPYLNPKANSDWIDFTTSIILLILAIYFYYSNKKKFLSLEKGIPTKVE